MHKFIKERPSWVRLVCLTWMVSEMGGKWPHSLCFVGCFFLGLFKTANSMLELISCSFFSLRFVSVHEVHLYSSMDTATTWKKFRFFLSDISDIHMIDKLSIALLAFARCMLTPLISRSGVAVKACHLEWRWLLSVLKHMYSVLFVFTWRPMTHAACSRLCRSDYTWTSVYAKPNCLK